MIINRLALEQGRNIMRLEIIIYVTNCELSLFGLGSVLGVESCKIERQLREDKISFITPN